MKVSDYETSRQKGDYGDLFDFDEELTKPLLDKVKSFIEIIEKQLN